MAAAVIGGIFAAALGLSISAGLEAVKSCVWAVVISIAGGGAGAIPIVLYHRLSGLISPAVCVLAGNIARLLITIVGAAIIICFVKTGQLWFVIWLGLFYAVVLTVEAYLFSLRLTGRNESRSVNH